MLKFALFSLFCFTALMAEEKKQLRYPCERGTWDEFYQQTAQTTKPTNELCAAIKFFEHPGFVVDLGVGTGKDTLYLLCRNWRVLAIDRESEAIKILLTRVPPDQKNRLETRLCSFTEMSLPGNIDLITSNSLPFLKPDEFARVWKNMGDHLAIGGRIAVHLFGDVDAYANRTLYPDMTTHSLPQVCDLFKDRFQIESLEDEKVLHPTLDGKSEEIWHAFYVVARKIRD